MTEGRLAPDEVRTRTFTRVVRGYKRREVRRLLERAATDLVRLRNGLTTGDPGEQLPLTPEEVEEARFQPSLGGYEMDEVDEFLDLLVVELERAAHEPLRPPSALPAPPRHGLFPPPLRPVDLVEGRAAAAPDRDTEVVTGSAEPTVGRTAGPVAGPAVEPAAGPGVGPVAGPAVEPAAGRAPAPPPGPDDDLAAERTGPGAGAEPPADARPAPAAGPLPAAQPRAGAGPLPAAQPPPIDSAVGSRPQPPPPTGPPPAPDPARAASGPPAAPPQDPASTGWLQPPPAQEPAPPGTDEGYFPPPSVPPSSAPAPPPPPPPARPPTLSPARPLTPSEVETRSFDRGAPGYLPNHVDLFLAKAARALAGRDGETMTRWDVLRQRFPLGPRGYATSDVDAFLVRLAAQFPDPEPAAQEEILRKLQQPADGP
jgi:DivIVA domain-containing protein